VKKSIDVNKVVGHLLTTSEVIQKLGISRSTLYRATKQGHYPQPVMLGTRSVRWRSKDIQFLVDGGVK